MKDVLKIGLMLLEMKHEITKVNDESTFQHSYMNPDNNNNKVCHL